MASRKTDKVSSVTAEDFFVQQHVVAQKTLRAYFPKKDSESLHQFRVSIKKIKAVLRMLKKMHPRFDLHNCFSPYQAIFKSAGPIREAFLQAEKSGDLKTISKKAIATSNKDFHHAALLFFQTSKAMLDENKQALHQLKKEDIYPYCKKLSGRLKSKWKKADTDEELHKFRKYIKQLLYCSHLLNNKEKYKLLAAKKYELLDDLQNLIGQWHDNVLLLDKIKQGGLQVDKTAYHKLEKDTQRHLKELKKYGDRL